MRKLATVAALGLVAVLPSGAAADPVKAPTTFTAPIICSDGTTTFTGSFSLNSGASGDQPHITWSPLFITAESGARYVFMGTSVDITVPVTASFAKKEPQGPWMCSTATSEFAASARGNLISRP